MKYVNFSPIDITQHEAVKIAKEVGSDNTITFITPLGIYTKPITNDTRLKAVGHDTLLLRINDNGKIETISSKGFN